MSRTYTELLDLASERLGGAVLFANDEFFAPKENLLRAKAAVWLEYEYTDRGKWMDGWETRRKRVPGHDWCLVRLGLPGVVRGVVIDTAFFRGNFPSHASIEACFLPGAPTVEDLLAPSTRWIELLPKAALAGDSKNSFEVSCPYRASHLRFNIYPDGGVARLRVHGEPLLDPKLPGAAGAEVDLAGAENGGHALGCSDMFFSSRHNLILPGQSVGMHDGWETKRRRGPGHDWVLLELGAEGQIARVEVDTSHFKGNYPDGCALEGWPGPSAGGEPWDDASSPASDRWIEVLPRTKLQAHTRHLFRDELRSVGPLTHVRFNIFPDGGVARLRLWGSPTAAGSLAAGLRRFNALVPGQAEDALLGCCGSAEWARRVAGARPFASRDALCQTADEVWGSLGEKDWLEAFARHPRIGQRRAARPQREQDRRWSEQEQSGTHDAEAATMEALAAGNQAYEQKFGFIFIVCATGKSAAEMLELFLRRLPNAPAEELRVAAEEQRKITRIRLEKLLLS
jgi:allantoicase